VKKQMKENYCLSSKDVIQAAIATTNKTMKDFEVDPIVMIIFSGGLLNYLKEIINLKESEWLLQYHPYGGGELYRGKYEGVSLSVILPQMGASIMASNAEDLIYCGAKTILLVCGSWGIGEKVKLLDYIIPTHGFGLDGTSLHYGRKLDEEVELNKEIVNILTEETKKKADNYHLGKNYSKEAFYRINKQEIFELRKKGCVSMENGEVNVLATICNSNDVKFGAIFYSYYNPLDRWNISWKDDMYKNCVNLEGEIALAALKRLIK
jgi:uridine phosphorylase